MHGRGKHLLLLLLLLLGGGLAASACPVALRVPGLDREGGGGEQGQGSWRVEGMWRVASQLLRDPLLQGQEQDGVRAAGAPVQSLRGQEDVWGARAKVGGEVGVRVCAGGGPADSPDKRTISTCHGQPVDVGTNSASMCRREGEERRVFNTHNNAHTHTSSFLRTGA